MIHDFFFGPVWCGRKGEAKQRHFQEHSVQKDDFYTYIQTHLYTVSLWGGEEGKRIMRSGCCWVSLNHPTAPHTFHSRAPLFRTNNDAFKVHLKAQGKTRWSAWKISRQKIGKSYGLLKKDSNSEFVVLKKGKLIFHITQL